MQNDLHASSKNIVKHIAAYAIVGAFLFWGLSTLHDIAFGFYHTLAELFSIIIAWVILIIGWNVQKINRNRFFLFLGISLALIGSIDLLHALSFSEVSLIPGYGVNLPTSLWIVARYAQSITFLLAPFLIRREEESILNVTIDIFYASIVLLVVLVFMGWFPVCFGPDGLTPFKKISEYTIIVIYAAGALAFYTYRHKFDTHVFHLLVAAIAISIVSEFLFTLYSTPEDYIEVWGHFLKIISFYLIYRALIVKSLNQPFETLFRAIKEDDARLRNKDALLSSINTIITEGLTSKTDWDLANKFLLVCQTMTNSKFGFVGELNTIGKLDNIAVSDAGWLECSIPKSQALKLIKNMELRGIWSTVIKDEIAHIINDPASHPASTGVPEGHPPITNFLGVPLKVGGKITGMVGLANKDGGFAPQDQEDVEQLALAFMEALLRKRAEEDLQRVAKFPEENPNPVIRISSDNIILYANSSSKLLLAHWGCKAGDKLPQLWPAEMSSDLKAEKTIHFEVSIGKQTFFFEATPFKENDYVNLYGRDISEQKQMEQEIQQRTEDLERSNRDLESFAYAASHDLQEPIRMISSFVQLLNQRYREKLDTDAEKYFDIVTGGTERMSRMISDLLEYSRIQTRGTPFVPVDLNQVLQSAFANLDRLVKETGAVITSDPLPTVTGDISQLGQLLQNLISNGIKYHQDSQPPVIHVGVLSPSDSQWHLYVRDNGIGIDPKYFDKLFVIFHRLHPRDKYPGTGIGLAICKRIIDRHNGRIWIESEAGNGATFHFTLPKRGIKSILA